MKYYNIKNLTFSQIEVFLCSAESNSFSSAALKLNFTQSMISKTIAGLEKDLGLILFLRGKNSNTLTPAGKELYKDWKTIFQQVEASIEKAHIYQTGVNATLTIGSVDTMIELNELITAVREYRKKYPNVALKYNEYTMSELIELAKEHLLDVIITTKFEEETLKKYGYSTRIIKETFLTIFVHCTNPLYQRESLNISDLHSESFIVLSPESNPFYIKLLNELCQANGFTPKISSYVSSAHSFKMNLLNNVGIVLAESLTKIQHDEIKSFVLSDLHADIIIAWAEQANNVACENFLSIINKFFYSQPE